MPGDKLRPFPTKEIRERGVLERFKERTIERALSRLRQTGRVKQIELGLNILGENGGDVSQQKFRRIAGVKDFPN